MKANEAKLLQVIQKAPQFVIPIYQRTYAWTELECRKLWEDVIRAGSDTDLQMHFVGSVVYIEDGLSTATENAPLLVIDGQQRLTTVTILLAALRDALENGDEPVDGFSARKIENRYLRDPDENGERSFKLLLTRSDRESLKAVVAGTEPPETVSLTVSRAYELMCKWIADLDDVKVLCRGLSKLIVVDVALSRANDNPQLIFESMNSTGRQLSQADLIRNFVLMGEPPEDQTRLYESYWHPMEAAFGQGAYAAEFDMFVRHYLTYRTGSIPRIGDVYEAFKIYAGRGGVADAGTEALLRDLRDNARRYCRMIPGTARADEPDTDLRAAFADLRELRVDTAFPWLLELFEDHEAGQLTSAEFLTVLRLIESYVFRRVVCGIPTNTLNKTFATFGRVLDKSNYVDSIEAHFTTLLTYRRFPADMEFKRELRTRDLYNMRQRSFWLRRFENYGRKERMMVEDYTIEHILPQNPNLPKGWRDDLGPDWEKIQETWLHTMGNLTLTGYNSEYRDKPFVEKRDMVGGFAESPLRLNDGLQHLDQWSETEIVARAERLSMKAVMIWPAPEPSVAALEQMRDGERQVASTNRTLEDHQHLAHPPTRALFDAWRREILALDPSVTEAILKLYVAFKAETNFADVVPQAKGLRVSFNLPFSDLVDPRNLCRDVSQIGRWGNGEVELLITSPDQIAYGIGIARQALERQMADTDTHDIA